MRKMRRWICLSTLTAGLLFVSANTSRAAMVLTAAGVTDGFTISTFADSFPNSGIGPVGIGVTGLGNVLVSDYNQGYVYNFPTDTDGQHANIGIRSTSFYGGNNPTGITTLNGILYMGRQGTGDVVQVDSSGNFLQHIANVPAATDLVADPAKGILYVSALGNGIFKVNPVTHTSVQLSGTAADGMTLSTDGSTLYVANGGNLLAVNTTTGAVTGSLGFISGLDGTALGTGVLAGKIYANTNFGNVVEVDLTTHAQTTIATGGSRGDLVKVDPTNGSLLLTQSDSVLRLTAPPGGGFGPAVPEPATVLSAGMASLLGIGLACRRRARSGA